MKRLLVIPDVHIPYQDSRAWSVMIRSAKVFKPDIIVVLGDFMDCADLSFHDRGIDRIATFKEECDEAVGRRRELDKLGAGIKHFCSGNHENRLPRYIGTRCPALIGVCPTIPTLLGLREAGWQWHDYGTPVRVGKMHFVHDLGHHGITAVRLSKQKAQKNIVFGHTHRAMTEYDGNIFGEKHVGISMGWLGDMKSVVTKYVPQTMKLHCWQHGFGIGYMNPQGVVQMSFVPILGREAIIEGKTVRAA